MDAPQKSDNEQTKLWNTAGNAWVEAQHTIDEMFKPFEERLVEAVRTKSARSVLDVGCGTGGTTLAVARALAAGGRAIGVDISEPMIAAARARVTQEATAAEFICANAETYGFDAESFDMIVSRFGVMFFEDPVRAFANLRRAAARGAELRFIAWRSPADNPFMTIAERAAAPLLPNLPVRQPDAPGQFAFANAQRIQSILEQSGWVRIDIRSIDVPCTLPEPELMRYLTRFGPVGRILDEVDEQTRVRVTETVRAAFDPYVHGSEVRFTAACWMTGGSSL